jgi:hypothetical protein
VYQQQAADLQRQCLQVGCYIDDATTVCSEEQDFHPEILQEEHDNTFKKVSGANGVVVVNLERRA